MMSIPTRIPLGQKWTSGRNGAPPYQRQVELSSRCSLVCEAVPEQLVTGYGVRSGRGLENASVLNLRVVVELTSLTRQTAVVFQLKDSGLRSLLLVNHTGFGYPFLI